MDYRIQNRPDYSKELFCYKERIPINYYTNRQMRTLYPHCNFIVAGEIGNKTGVQCGVVENLDNQAIPVYKEKTHNAVTEAIAGYAAIDRHTYLAVVKNVLSRRIFTFVLVLALIAACMAIIFELRIF